MRNSKTAASILALTALFAVLPVSAEKVKGSATLKDTQTLRRKRQAAQASGLRLVLRCPGQELYLPHGLQQVDERHRLRGWNPGPV